MSDITLNIEKGLPFYKAFEYNEIVNGIQKPIDITNASVNMQFRHTAGNPNVLFDAIEGEHITISNPKNGEVSILIPAEITKSFNFSSAVFDIILNQENKQPIRLIGGQVKVQPLVTRK